MASPISTGGFNVSALPGINYLPASQMTANLSGIMPAFSQGLSVASQLQQIQDEAQGRPIRQQLQQIALQDAQANLAGRTANDKLKMLQIAHAGQPMERILSTEISRIQKPHDINDSVTVDDNGRPIFAEGDTNYDLVPIQKVEVTDPSTGEKAVIERRLTPITTSEQLEDRQDKLEISKLREESLSGQRKAQAELAAARLSSPDWTRVGYGTNPAGKEVFIIMNKKTGQKQEIPTDLMPVQSGLGAIGAVLQGLTGGSATPAAAPVNIAAPAPAFSLNGQAGQLQNAAAVNADAAVDEETQALIDRLSSSAPAAAPTAFKTPADAEAAAAAGLIKKGQKITVGGRSATWQ